MWRVFEHEVEALLVVEDVVHGQDQRMVELEAGLGFNLDLLGHGVLVDFAFVKHLHDEREVEGGK